MNKKKKYTIVDIFSGVGGLSLGFEENGFELLFANDNDVDAGNTFKLNHPKAKFICSNIQELTDDDLIRLKNESQVDVLVGGVPCQSFSMVGYRTTGKDKNLNDSRHYLFKEFIRAAKVLKPKVVIIENVKAILSSHGGEIRKSIIKELQEIGYNVDYDVLNAANYGVAQLRERAVFLGNNMGVTNRFPKKTHTTENFVTIKDAFKDLPEVNHEPRELKGKVLERVKLLKPGQNWKNLPIELQTGSKHSGAYGRLEYNKPSRTLTTRFDTPPGGYVTHPEEDRALTVREGARIQGFPDNFVFTGNKVSQYRQVGNAVAVGMSRELAKSVLKMLNDEEKI